MSIGAVAGSGYAAPPSSDPVPALQGVVRRAEQDLQDWLTCVSASTPKGKAEIQSLSAQVSAARAAISRAQQTEGAARNGSPDALTYSASAAPPKAATAPPTRALDVWA